MYWWEVVDRGMSWNKRRRRVGRGMVEKGGQRRR